MIGNIMNLKLANARKLRPRQLAESYGFVCYYFQFNGKSFRSVFLFRSVYGMRWRRFTDFTV